MFARAQCGDDALAGQAVAAAVSEFRRTCADKPLAMWPADFWTAMLAQPQLLQGKSRLLPQLSVGPRAALLLRLVAGLDVRHAAQVLSVSEAAYRMALSHALQQLDAGGGQPEDLQALRERLQQEIKQAPTVPETVAHQIVEKLDADDRQADASVLAKDEIATNDPAWLLPLKILLAVLLLAFVVSFFWTPWRGLAPGESEPLPAEVIETIAPGDASALVTHPDFALLAAPADEVLAKNLDFYSWLAAGGQQQTEAAPASPSSLPQSTAPESTGPTQEDAP